MISSFLPYPLFSGGQVRLYNLIKQLSKRHEITLICEKRDRQTEDDVKEIEKICKKVVMVNRKKQWTIKNIIQSVSSQNSFLITGHTQNGMKAKIQRELDNSKYDLIHVETYYVMQNLPDVSIPVVLTEHNIEYQVYQKFSNTVNPVLRFLLSYDIAKIKREEEKFWKKATKLVAVSEEDAEVMKGKALSPVIVSNGVDVEKFIVKYKTGINKSQKILFIGDFKWIQNQDSIRFIIKDIWPLLKKEAIAKEKSIKLWVVGRNIPNSIKGLTNDPDMVFDQQGSDRPTEELFQEADVLLAPIRVGGGTSYKILESMSSGTPVVTMQLSADAIHASDKHEIMIGENASDLADKTIKLLSDEKLYETVVKNGRELIEKNYTWEKIAKNLEEVYGQVVR